MKTRRSIGVGLFLAAGLVIALLLLSGCGRSPGPTADSSSIPVDTTSPTVDPAVPIVATFPDPVLDRAIRDAIGKQYGDIYRTELEGLETLDLRGLGINTLDGIDHCVNLQTLDLRNNAIVIIRPLSRLTSLTRLDLRWNLLDLTPGSSAMLLIEDLLNRGVSFIYEPQNPNLDNLDPELEAAIREAIWKPTGEITPADLVDLTILEASSWGITSLEGLQYCNNLTHLDLSDNQISDLTPLAGLTNLTELWLYTNQISDLTGLADLTHLTVFSLRENQITDLTPLSGLIKLTALDLSGNQITDLAPLAGLTNLTELYLGNTQISDVTPLSGLIKLTTLYLHNNQITDLTPLENLIQLTDLFLGKNFLDLTPGSPTMLIIEDFRNRGALVYY